MNMPKYAKIVFCVIILTIGIRYGWTQSQPIKPESEPNSISDADRDNPFAAFLGNKNSAAQKVPQTSQLDEEPPELFLETVTLKFLDAQNLKKAIAKMSSKYGSIETNSKNNSLIICDIKDNLSKILLEIKRADNPPQQLMIEAVIVDVQLDDETEIGINWDILSDKMYDFSYRQNLGSRLSMVAATDDTKADTTAFNTTSATGTEGGYFAVISGTVRNTVHLLQQKKNVEILASPRVMVVSGESASIETVTELPYQELMQTSGGGQLSATQFKKVGVKLNVTATLTDDDYILVTVEPEQSVDTGKFSATSGIPIIDTRKAKTTLLLKDGQVVIIGGLRKKETTNQISQIPLLGDLPLIGILFRNTQEIVKNSELLVFLSPHIYKGETLSEEQKAKFEEFKEQPTLSLPTDGDKDNQLHNADKQPQKK
jgi:type IV pilus assembly protein PilQ